MVKRIIYPEKLHGRKKSQLNQPIISRVQSEQWLNNNSFMISLASVRTNIGPFIVGLNTNAYIGCKKLNPCSYIG